jgi:hypothetical protein
VRARRSLLVRERPEHDEAGEHVDQDEAERVPFQAPGQLCQVDHPVVAWPGCEHGLRGVKASAHHVVPLTFTTVTHRRRDVVTNVGPPVPTSVDVGIHRLLSEVARSVSLLDE